MCADFDSVVVRSVLTNRYASGSASLTGGNGNDTFVFAAGFGNDLISDFDANPMGGQDLLELSGFGITAANFASRVASTRGPV